MAIEEGKALGPAVPVALRGRIHWGWILSKGGRMSILSACGEAKPCHGPSVFSASRINCQACKAKAVEHPDVIAGKPLQERVLAKNP